MNAKGQKHVFTDMIVKFTLRGYFAYLRGFFAVRALKMKTHLFLGVAMS
jgi:hypothetical protein